MADLQWLKFIINKGVIMKSMAGIHLEYGDKVQVEEPSDHDSVFVWLPICEAAANNKSKACGPFTINF